MKLTESGISDSVKDKHIVDVSLDSIEYNHGCIRPKICRFTMTARHNSKNTDIITECINDGKYISAHLFVNRAKLADVTKSKIFHLPYYAYNIDGVELEGNMLKIHFSSGFLVSKKQAQMVEDILNSTKFYIETGKGFSGYYYIQLYEVYENNRQ